MPNGTAEQAFWFRIADLPDMTPARFQAITEKYPALRIAVVGDFCLDRYLEIDPGKQEISIETGLPVHNVVNVRSQPGGAGTILNNLVALGIGEIYPVGFCGTDGEGFELQRALRAKGGSVHLDFFFATDARRTFTYSKPLLPHAGKAPQELSRLDSKNWTPTPALVQGRILDAVQELAPKVDGMILLDQVDVPETGVITSTLLRTISGIVQKRPEIWLLADSRRGLRDYPRVCLKMNRAELASLTGVESDPTLSLQELKQTAAVLAQRQGRNVF